MSCEPKRVKIASVVLVSKREQKLGSQKERKLKKLKTTREWYFTHLPGRPHWGDRFEFWHTGSFRQRSHPRQIWWQMVQEFRSSNTPNFAILHRNSWSPLQQCNCKHCRATLAVMRNALNIVEQQRWTTVVHSDLRFESILFPEKIDRSIRPCRFSSSLRPALVVLRRCVHTAAAAFKLTPSTAVDRRRRRRASNATVLRPSPRSHAVDGRRRCSHACERMRKRQWERYLKRRSHRTWRRAQCEHTHWNQCVIIWRLFAATHRVLSDRIFDIYAVLRVTFLSCYNT